jgi:pimeloyl-ACP methyl ester carboxylesterase
MGQVRTYTLRDGRALAVHELGAGGERTVVLCHPAPGAGGFDPAPELTAQRDVTLLVPDRAGYGSSDPLPADAWATVDRAADDLAEVLDARAAGPVGVAGWSAGGRVALALAARRPDLVDRLSIFGTPAPDAELAWLPEAQRDALAGLGEGDPAAARDALAPLLEPYTAARPESLAALDYIGGTEVDAAVLDDDPGARERLAAMLGAAYRNGPAAFLGEVAAHHLRPWGFEPGEVKAKTLLTYGTKDPVAANRHAQWWQKRLAQARVEMAPGAGPLTILRLWKRALSHLTPAR